MISEVFGNSGAKRKSADSSLYLKYTIIGIIIAIIINIIIFVIINVNFIVTTIIL